MATINQQRTSLYEMRNPQPGPGDPRVVNNPVVVAAEHYFVAYQQAKQPSNLGLAILSMAFLNPGSAAKNLMSPAERIDVYYKMKERFPQAADKLSKQALTMNQNQPASPYDPKIKAWGIRGWEAATGRRWGIGGHLLSGSIDATANSVEALSEAIDSITDMMIGEEEP